VPRGESTPIRQVLLKVHSRCNLSCDYCYVYEHVDQSWRAQPRAMSRRIVDLAARRIEEHVRAHDLDRVTVILHGGEPLLAGVPLLEHVALATTAAAPVDLHVQTNGLLLDDAFLALFARHGVKVGVSIDGGAAAHDRHRRFAGGAGSYAAVAPAIERLAGHPELYSGLLATVDLANDPIEVYTDLLAFAPPRLDLLLPHGNWSSPPPGRPADQSRTPYADWLITIFDRWYGAPRRETGIRMFDSIISLLLGGPGGSEALGLAPVDLITVETDGSIEQGDVLKTTAPGMAATGLHLATHSFDDALAHPGVRARQLGLDGLAGACRACPLVRVCGGGLYAHRYHEANGFANPSVYCADLTKLITHVRDRLRADLARVSRPGQPVPVAVPA
jgi:uncharacterized protein